MTKKTLKTVIIFILTCTFIGGIATYWEHELRPTIDDSTVVSDVLQIAPQISGPVIKMNAREYQRVSKGDLLFEIDPEPFKISLERSKAIIQETKKRVQELEDDVVSARAILEKSLSDLELAQKDYDRKAKLTERGAVSQSDLDQSTANLQAAKAMVSKNRSTVAKAMHALGDVGEKNAELREAEANMHADALNLGFTKVVAPVDGFVTNLRISVGSFVKTGELAMTLISDENWRVIALVRETQLRRVKPGQEASIYLPAYPDKRFRGKVYGIGWGIAPSIIENVTGGLTDVSPTLDWVRLAQRFPVQISFLEREDEYPIRVGMTATVQIDTTTQLEDDD